MINTTPFHERLEQLNQTHRWGHWSGYLSALKFGMFLGVQDLTWLPDGTAVIAQGRTLHRWRAGENTWTPLGSELAGVGTITRLAASPDGKRLAFVADPAAR